VLLRRSSRYASDQRGAAGHGGANSEKLAGQIAVQRGRLCRAERVDVSPAFQQSRGEARPRAASQAVSSTLLPPNRAVSSPGPRTASQRHPRRASRRSFRPGEMVGGIKRGEW